jgi:hypothetical protein
MGSRNAERTGKGQKMRSWEGERAEIGSGNAEVEKWTKLAGKLGGPDAGKFLPLAFHLLPFTLNLKPYTGFYLINQLIPNQLITR